MSIRPKCIYGNIKKKIKKIGWETLKPIVLENSENKTDINDAIDEWNIVNYYITEEPTNCLCGKEQIIFISEIRNLLNGNTLQPIGSRCMKRFGNDRLENQLSLISKGNHIFKNKGKRYDGQTYCEICKDHKYIEYIRIHGTKKRYEKLVEYYDFINEN
jgi:hypothetical protein